MRRYWPRYPYLRPKVGTMGDTKLTVTALAATATRRIIWVALIAGSMAALAVLSLHETGPLMAASVVIAVVGITPAMYIGVALRGLNSVRLNISVKEPVVEGEVVEVRVDVENRSRAALELIEVTVHPSPYFKVVKGSTTAVMSLGPNERASFSYYVKVRAGTHIFPEPRVVVKDIMGLVRIEGIASPRPTLRVYPRIAHTPTVGVALASRPAGIARTKRRGRGVEFYGVREYVPGDEFRWIAWKASARTGMRKLFVKEFEEESSVNVFIVIDTHPSMFAGPPGSTIIEYVMRSVAEISAYALRRGDSVAVLYAGRGVTHENSPVRGMANLGNILRVLSSITWPEAVEHVPPPYSSLVRTLAKDLPKVLPRERNTVIVFTSLPHRTGSEELIKALERIRRQGNHVMLVAPLVEFFELAGLSGLEAAVYRLRAYASIRERDEVIRELRKRGIPAIVVGPRDISDAVIRRLEWVRAVA